MVDLPEPGEAQVTVGGGGETASGGEGGSGGEPPITCPAGTKLCGEDCVGIDNPATGCADPSCDACAIPNAQSICFDGACAAGDCLNGYRNCDGSVATGCEVHIAADLDNCGDCGAGCSYLNAGATCMTGLCTMGTCNVGFDDCDSDTDTGCEINVAYDPDNCMTCTNMCPDGGGTAVCNNGSCEVSSCIPPLADCDADPSDCETNTDTSNLHCSFCNNPCQLTDAVAQCSGGTCTLVSCVSGKGNCDGNDFNGCETNVLVSGTHCGRCDHGCLGGVCVDGECQPVQIDGDAVGQIVLSDNMLYFASHDGARSVGVQDANASTIVDGLEPMEGIAVDGVYVYMSSFDSGQIFRAARIGGGPEVVANAQQPWEIDVDDTHLYFTQFTAATGGVYRVPLDAGVIEPEQVVSGSRGSGLLVAPGRLVFTERNSLDGAITASIGGVRSQFTVVDSPWAVIGNDSFLFWTTGDATRSIERADVAGDGITTLATVGGQSQFLATDATHVYWTVEDDGIYRVPIAGGETEQIHAGTSPYAIAVDTQAIFFNDKALGRLYKLAKP